MPSTADTTNSGGVGGAQAGAQLPDEVG